MRTVDGKTVRKFLVAVREALPTALRKKAIIEYNKRSENYSIKVRPKKDRHDGFLLSGWDSDRWRIHKGSYRGIALSLIGAKWRYNGRENFNYPVRKDGTISIDKIIKAITNHREALKKAKKRDQAESELQDKIQTRMDGFISTLKKAGFETEHYGHGDSSPLRVTRGTDTIRVGISRDLESDYVFHFSGMYLYYTAEDILELLLTMFRLTKKVPEEVEA